MQENKTNEITMMLEGLTCATCAEKIERSISERKDVQSARLDIINSKLTIQFSPEQSNPQVDDIKAQILAIEDVNIVVENQTSESLMNHESSVKIRIAIGTLGLLVSLLTDSVVLNVVSLTVYAYVGYPVIKKAWKRLRNKDMFDENFLMSIATLGAIAINEIPEALGVMLFYTIGEYFQDKAVSQSKNAISQLLDISVNQAVVLTEGKRIIKNPHEVIPGEIVLVAKGEKVPCDGKIVNGVSIFDNKSLTGEPLPIQLGPDDQINAGAINLGNPVSILVEYPYEDSSLSRLIRYIEKASTKKAKSELFITKFASVYTPVVVITSLIVFIVSALLLGDMNEGLYRGLIFLVISCPCAMVISVPLGYFAAMGHGSKQGILFKGGQALESAVSVNTVLFDKTGTLTKGDITVAHREPIQGFDLMLADSLVHTLESQSTHPIAKALVKATQSDMHTVVSDIGETAGVGIHGFFKGQKIEIVSNREVEMNESLMKIAEQYPMAVVLKVAGNLAAIYFLDDELKPDSKSAINKLQSLNIEPMMISGDREPSVSRVARELKISRFYSQLLPDEKLSIGERLKNEGKKIAFVGDGVNDAAIISLSDCGIAMGGIGSNLTIEAADIVLLKDQPGDVVRVIEIARKTRRIMVTNFAFIFSVKVIILILGSLGYASMWAAVFADVGVSLLALLNAIRILRHEN